MEGADWIYLAKGRDRCGGSCELGSSSIERGIS
jgi:hypothetical protein